jgi:hypothetical protein
MPPVIYSRTVTLYAPSIDKTIKFQYDPSKPHSDILASVRTALGVDLVFAYNLKHRAVIDFSKVKARTRTTLLIATDYFELPLSSSVRDVFIVQEGAEAAWKELSIHQQRDHITALRITSMTPKTYLTLPFADVLARLEGATTTPLRTLLDIIEENWSVPIQALLGLQGLVKPFGEVESWDQGLISAMAVLSDATVGQHQVASNFIMDAVFARKGKIVEARDVVQVGKELYRRAGVME